MNPLKVKLNFQCVAGEKENGVFIVGETKGYEYDSSGKRTNKQNSVIYSAISKYLGYEPLRIRVPGLKPVITQEEIDSSEDPVFITCEGFVGKFYRDASGSYQLSCKASSIRLLEEIELDM